MYIDLIQLIGIDHPFLSSYVCNLLHVTIASLYDAYITRSR
jgi:hypothetical protein